MFSLFYAVSRGDFLFAVRKIIIKIVKDKGKLMKYKECLYEMYR